jgi:hypothetical protein
MMMLSFLLVQFMLGMAVNLFVKIPKVHPGARASDYFAGIAAGVPWAITQDSPWLSLHGALGLLLVVGSLTVLAQAIRARRRGWMVVAILGFMGVLAAGFNGASFVNYGEDFSSMLMATGFALASAAYVSGLYTGAD